MLKVLYKYLQLRYIWVKPTRLTKMISTKQLITLNLKYGTETKPLKDVAFAQLVSKALYLADSPLSQKQIAVKVKELLGIQKVTRSNIVGGLTYLKDEGKVTEKNAGMWELTLRERSNIESNLNTDQHLMEDVIERHFPSDIDKKIIREWFIDAATDFFGHFGDELVTSITKNTKTRPKDLKELLKPSINKYSLLANSLELEKGFVDFISCDDDRDKQYFMQLIYAMFSARLVAADLGYDPIAVDEVKNATLVLDTNVLFVLALERHKSAKALKAVINTLNKLGSRVVYLDCTRQEYSRAVSHVKKSTLEIVNYGYPWEVLVNTTDSFMRTAIKRGCSKEEHFNEFFRSIMSVPDTSEFGFSLSFEADAVTEEVSKKAENDKGMQAKIQDFNTRYGSKLREYPIKSPSSLIHDATLIHVCDAKRKEGEKYWVLSLDRSLQMYAVNNTNPHGVSTVISLDILVQVLALNTTAGAVDSNEFAPFLAIMMLNECLPTQGAYSMVDLKTMAQISDEVKILPPANIDRLVDIVKKARFAGKPIDSSQFLVSFNRALQTEKENVGEELRKAHETIESYKVDLDKEKEKSLKVTSYLQDDHKSKLSRRYLRDLVIKILISIIIGLVIGTPILVFLPKVLGEAYEAYIFLVTTVPVFASALWIIPKSVKTYKASMARIETEAQKEVTESISGK
ncbi:hypothetical protein C4561_00770 [candidate division WWE3 bacterium]|jgi:hypothetical protein|uniref:Uncharacterized protein n=1 Tax=candidate division WWE3 bacterium TaxID=2053526 RepID=A0A3A4ZFX6_UNCKA|nr:MAG: hypothetical protein C4561_00770 [candidate division WWE3 bacterium]